MKRYLGLLSSFFLVVVALAPLSGQDAGAIASGNWSNASIWTTNTVPGAGNNVFIGSTSPSGSATSATVTLTQNHSANNVYLGYGAGTNGTLDLGNFVLTANSLNIGSGGTGSITRGVGSFQVNGLALSTSASVNLSVNDVVTGNISVSGGSTLTLASAQNLTGGMSLESGGTLTLGGNLSMNGDLFLNGTGTVLNAQGFNITAGSRLFYNWNAPGAVLNNRGNLTLGGLYIAGQSFQLTPADNVYAFHISNGSTNLGAGVTIGQLGLSNNSTATTSNSNNITADIAVSGGSTLTLASAQNLTGGMWVESGGSLTLGGNLSMNGDLFLHGTGTVLNAQGFNITAGGRLFYNWNAPGANLTNDGSITVDSWLQGNATTSSLHNGNDTISNLILAGNSILKITDSAGQSTGLTLLGLTVSSLNIDSTSKLILDINGLASDWILRWANPNGGDHITDLTSLISQGRIEFNNTGNFDYQIYSSPDGYTYVINAVPEPSTLLLIGLAGAGSLGYYRRYRKQRQSQQDLLIG